MTTLEQLTCEKCRGTYHKPVDPDVIRWRSICDNCIAAPDVEIRVEFRDYRLTIDRMREAGLSPDEPLY